MKRFILTGALLALTVPALAQTPPAAPPFVPWTVNAAQNDEIVKYLAEQPYKVSAPILGWIQQRENEAVAKAKEPAPGPAKK